MMTSWNPSLNPPNSLIWCSFDTFFSQWPGSKEVSIRLVTFCHERFGWWREISNLDWWTIRTVSNGWKFHSRNVLILLLIWHSFCSQRPFSYEVVLANCGWKDPKKSGSHDPKKIGSSGTAQLWFGVSTWLKMKLSCKSVSIPTSIPTLHSTCRASMMNEVLHSFRVACPSDPLVGTGQKLLSVRPHARLMRMSNCPQHCSPVKIKDFAFCCWSARKDMATFVDNDGANLLAPSPSSLFQWYGRGQSINLIFDQLTMTSFEKTWKKRLLKSYECVADNEAW